MKPARFDFVRAESVGQAIEALAQAGSDAKVLAGGQSLLPMMNFRLVKPSVLVDINQICGLDAVSEEGTKLSLGALVRHRVTAEHSLIARRVPVLHQAMKHVAHLTVRNRGTFCGSLCHADPSAEIPMLTLLLDGVLNVVSRRGSRSLPAKDFFLRALVTALAPDELVKGVELTIPDPDAGWGFEEFARRHGDYALGGVAVILSRRAGRVEHARMAVMGVSETPLRVYAVEESLNGRPFSDASVDDAVEILRGSVTPMSDMNASAEYRRHLVGALARRALAAAWSRAKESVL
ncbi:MAG: xanthine dehydrogenase family protein subunit M [Hyphomonadaceae bacterium]